MHTTCYKLSFLYFMNKYGDKYEKSNFHIYLNGGNFFCFNIKQTVELNLCYCVEYAFYSQ